MADIFNMLGQFKQMQEKLQTAQEELERLTFTASTGGGMVTAECDGKLTVKRIKIDRTVVDPNDVGTLEALVLAAVTEAQRKAAKGAQDELAKVTGGIDLPFKLPF